MAKKTCALLFSSSFLKLSSTEKGKLSRVLRANPGSKVEENNTCSRNSLVSERCALWDKLTSFQENVCKQLCGEVVIHTTNTRKREARAQKLISDKFLTRATNRRCLCASVLQETFFF